MQRGDRSWARKLYRSFHRDDAGTFDEWLEVVLHIDVDLHPGGRATLVHPGIPLPVEVRWVSRDHISSFKIEAIPGEHIPWTGMPPMSAYIAALGIAVAEGSEVIASIDADPTGAGEGSARLTGRGRLKATGTVTPRPHPGRPVPIDFYRALVAEYDQLIRDAHRSPVAELGRRYGAKPGTVKSWLSRGREYLKKERGAP